MIIDDFHIFGACNRPAEADPELIVDADAVLPRAAALQSFKPVTGRNAKILDSTCNLQLPQLAPRSVATREPRSGVGFIGLLYRYFDVLNSALRKGNWQAIFTHTLEMKFDGFTDLLL